jgi:cold shock protein
MADSSTVQVTMEAAEGQVKWFNNQKGYGFIVKDDSPDIFVHHSAINMEGYRTLKPGEAVEFDLIQGEKGCQAINVKRLGKKPDPDTPQEI